MKKGDRTKQELRTAAGGGSRARQLSNWKVEIYNRP